VNHASPFRYFLVWLGLMVLALGSFLLSRAHLGPLDSVIALAIAAAKTALVVLFFMELIEHRFINSLVLIVSTGFVVLLVSLMVADVLMRQTFPAAPLPAMESSAK
jgi:cytochrome c oxidase subunit IV